jgi:hypothetical protein
MKAKALLAALCGIVFTAHAWDSSENQVWLEGALKGQLSETLSYRLGEQVRYNEAGFNHYYRHTEPCIQWKFASGWTFAPAFRYSTATQKGVTRSTTAWHLNLVNTTSFLGMDLQSRARMYYSDPHGSPEETDFRPKLCFSPTQGWTLLKAKPFLADELMINLDQGRVYLNRLTLGIKCSPVKRVSLCAFIAQDRVENSTKTAWNERYNYGITACLSL